MEDNTPTVVIVEKKSIFKFSYAVIAALIVVIIFMATCNPFSRKSDVEKVARLESQHREDSAILEYQRSLSDVAIMNANNRAKATEDEADSAWRIVEATKGKIEGLTARYNNLRKNIPEGTSTEVSVEPEYILTCDSCFDMVRELNKDVLHYKEKSDTAGSAMKEVVVQKDTAIAIEKRATASEKKHAEGWKQLYYAEKTYNAPRTKFIPGLIGGYDILSGVTYGVQANLLLKNGTLFHANAQTGKTNRVEIGVSKTISFRKR